MPNSQRDASTPERLCPPCLDLFHRWADAPMLARGVRIHTVGDSNPRHVADARRARAQDHYALIRRQSAGVVANCRAGRHATPREREGRS